MKRYTRRRILTGAAGAFASSIAAGFGYRRHRGPSAGAPDIAVVDALVRLVAPGRGFVEAAELGSHYLAAMSGQGVDAIALSREILPSPTARRAFLAAGDDGRRRIVEARAAADFGAGRVAEIDGWVLSRTEAALCGIIARA